MDVFVWADEEGADDRDRTLGSSGQHAGWLVAGLENLRVMVHRPPRGVSRTVRAMKCRPTIG